MKAIDIKERQSPPGPDDTLPDGERYVLRLYVTGETPRSRAAISAVDALCKEHLQGRYDLEVVDVYKHPHLAREDQLVALPMLVKKLPAPLRHLIGNLSDMEKVLLGMDLQPAPPADPIRIQRDPP